MIQLTREDNEVVAERFVLWVVNVCLGFEARTRAHSPSRFIETAGIFNAEAERALHNPFRECEEIVRRFQIDALTMRWNQDGRCFI